MTTATYNYYGSGQFVADLLDTHAWARAVARTERDGGDVVRRCDGITLLTHDSTGDRTGHLGTPCSRYGRNAADCAPVAWRLAYVLARESGEAVTVESLDYAMGLVVNDHDDVAYIIRTYGHRMYR